MFGEQGEILWVWNSGYMGGEDGGKISRGQIIKGHVCLGKELDFTLKAMGTNKAFKKGGGMIRFVC